MTPTTPGIGIDMTGDCLSLRQLRELTRKTWPEVVTPTSELVVTISRLRDLLFENSRGLILGHGLTTAEFDVLVALRKAPPPHELTPTALRKAMLITSGGLTKVLHQLQDRGLIRRINCESDRRLRKVRITPKGKALAETTLPRVLENDTRLLHAVISSQELRQLNQGLQKLLYGAEALTRK